MKLWWMVPLLVTVGGVEGVLIRESLTRDDLIVCVIRPEYGPMVDNRLTVNVFCMEVR